MPKFKALSEELLVAITNAVNKFLIDNNQSIASFSREIGYDGPTLTRQLSVKSAKKPKSMSPVILSKIIPYIEAYLTENEKTQIRELMKVYNGIIVKRDNHGVINQWVNKDYSKVFDEIQTEIMDTSDLDSDNKIKCLKILKSIKDRMTSNT